MKKRRLGVDKEEWCLYIEHLNNRNLEPREIIATIIWELRDRSRRELYREVEDFVYSETLEEKEHKEKLLNFIDRNINDNSY